MANPQKRPSSVLSSNSASHSPKRRCINREDQNNSELPHPSSTTATSNTQCHGGPPKPSRAPKLDEAQELSPMSEAPVGIFASGDIPLLSLDHSLPSPQQPVPVFKVSDERPTIRQEDHLPGTMGALGLEDRLTFPSVRADRQHHEPAFAFVGQDLDTVLVPRYHNTHTYFSARGTQEPLAAASSLPFGPALLRTRSPEASPAAHQQQHNPSEAINNGEEETEEDADAMVLRSWAPEVASQLEDDADDTYPNGFKFEAYQSFTPRTPSSSFRDAVRA